MFQGDFIFNMDMAYMLATLAVLFMLNCSVLFLQPKKSGLLDQLEGPVGVES